MLKWERNYHAEGIQDRNNKYEVWSADWWVIHFRVTNATGKWKYFIYGKKELVSKKEYETKEDAFTAVEKSLNQNFGVYHGN